MIIRRRGADQASDHEQAASFSHNLFPSMSGLAALDAEVWPIHGTAREHSVCYGGLLSECDETQAGDCLCPR